MSGNFVQTLGVRPALGRPLVRGDDERFAVYSPLFYMRQPLNWNFVWAGLCLLGAVYFMFR